MKNLLVLFWVFFKASLYSFGGGYMMFMLFKHELVKKRKWITETELLDYFAIGTSIPGIISMNVATFSGYKLGKVPGAVAATLGCIMPSVIIISLLFPSLHYFINNPYMVSALNGIEVGLVALMALFVYDLGKIQLRALKPIVICAVSLALIFLCDMHPIFVVLAAGGLSYAMNRKWRRKRK